MYMYVRRYWYSGTPCETTLGTCEGGLSKEVVSDERETNVGHICDRQSWSLKRGGLSQGWSLKRGTTVHTMVSTHPYIHTYVCTHI